MAPPSASSYMLLPLLSNKVSWPIAVANIVMRWSGTVGLALTQVTPQAPDTVVQLPSIEPPSAVKLTAVPSGTGLLKVSAKRTTKFTSCSLILNASGFKLSAVTVKLFWSGRPVLTVNKSDWVTMVSPDSVSTSAVTRTEVGTSPAVTRVLTWPCELVRPVLDESVKPPVSVFKLNATSCWAKGLPNAPFTWNTKVETDELFCPPVPRSTKELGSAETNAKEPIDSAWIEIVWDTLSVALLTTTEATIESVLPSPPAQLWSSKVAFATPFIVLTKVSMVAKPSATQLELKVTGVWVNMRWSFSSTSAIERPKVPPALISTSPPVLRVLTPNWFSINTLSSSK